MRLSMERETIEEGRIVWSMLSVDPAYGAPFCRVRSVMSEQNSLLAGLELCDLLY